MKKPEKHKAPYSTAGVLHLGFTDLPADSIIDWAMKYKFKNGNLKMLRSDENEGSYVPEEELTLIEAACVSLRLVYNRHSGSHFNTQLVISSNSSVLGDTDDWVNKEWKLL